MGIQQRILRFITCSNWILLLIASIAAGMVAKFDFTMGIIAGGLMVTINFHLTYRTLQKAFNRPRLPSVKSIIARHYFRFVLSAVFIFVLISKHLVDPGGLLIGLSIVVVSIQIAALYELKNIIFKEAI
jgi:multisubunit Na+/H+ antiporter MnhB subunit